MRYWYDTEFLENGHTIKMISIGVVAEDGREYYAINQELVYNVGFRLNVQNNRWLMDNVVPHLPQLANYHLFGEPWLFDYNSPLVKRRDQIRADLEVFFQIDRNVEEPELWADYAAYDHVVLCQLWGRMIDLPTGMPMFTHDIQQEAARLGISNGLPDEVHELDGTPHHALYDARQCRIDWEFLDTYSEPHEDV